MLKFRNTLSGRVEEFRPLREGEVKFYYCGPTVWNYGHIGNFRSAVAADIVRRYLKFKGYKVTHVMNITDVEDRIIAESQKAGLTIDESCCASATLVVINMTADTRTGSL